MSFRAWADCPYCGGAGFENRGLNIDMTDIQSQINNCPVCAKVCELEEMVRKNHEDYKIQNKAIADLHDERDRLKAALKEIEDYSCPAGCDAVARVALDSAKDGDA